MGFTKTWAATLRYNSDPNNLTLYFALLQIKDCNISVISKITIIYNSIGIAVTKVLFYMPNVFISICMQAPIHIYVIYHFFILK